MIQLTCLLIIILTFCAQTLFAGTICGDNCEEVAISSKLYPLLFTENDIRKAFINPNANSRWGFYRSGALELCALHNATLVDIESHEKQLLVQTYLAQFSFQKVDYRYTGYWLGGHSDDAVTYKWMNSGNEFSYKNWASGQPILGVIDFGHFDVRPYTYIAYTYGQSLGEWLTDSAFAAHDVFCEITLNF